LSSDVVVQDRDLAWAGPGGRGRFIYAGAEHEAFCVVSRLATPLDCGQWDDLQDMYRNAVQEKKGTNQRLWQTS
jgi:hypothetical protein